MKNGSYRNPDASKEWFGPSHPAKVIIKKSILPQSNVCGRILKLWSTGSLFQMCVQLLLILILNNWYEFMKFLEWDTQH